MFGSRRSQTLEITILWTQFVLRCCSAVGNSAPKALSIPPSQYWDGNDGFWSTFGVQLGSPNKQSVRLLPGSNQGAVWVVHPQGCTSDDNADCGNARGTLVLNNRTQTWVEKGTYDLQLVEEEKLGYSGAGLYGWDTVELGWATGLPVLPQQIITEIATKDFYIGVFPLSPWPVNFTELDNSTPSLLSRLKNQSHIPSLSWGYTAGMHKHDPPVFGSLTLGGYDTSRFEDNKLNFTMGIDQSRDLLVAVQRITSSTTSTPLLSKPIYAFINSVVPHLWLPVSACEAFEKAFNLTWDATSQLYLVSSNVHQSLLQTNPTVTFEIGPSDTGENVKIQMPYGSFDMNASFPLVKPEGNSSLYFPLRRADNDTQYTLGRAFLQNAYIAANYEYFNFTVKAAKYPPNGAQQSLVMLPAKGTSNSKTRSGLSTGGVIGIAVAGGVIGLIAMFLIWFFLIKKRKSKQDSELLRSVEIGSDHVDRKELDGMDSAIAEADNVYQRNELESVAVRHELDSKGVKYHRLPVELPANEVAAHEFHTPTSTPYGSSPARTPTTTTSTAPYRHSLQRLWQSRGSGSEK
ncbi:acid protease [Tothia fuscella]|uniref:Acid protease n=1 Tax=Tothia fuscella TaxID=1048955 RepID=A0A9P4TWG7_9PEZI|nr:acid protease [Tothia fuscella]